MNDSRDSHHFILLRKKHGRRRGKNSHALTRGQNSERSKIHAEPQPHLEVLAGSLLLLVEVITSHGKSECEFEILDEAPEGQQETSVRVICIINDDVRNLTQQELNLLRPIPTCKERLEVFIDSSWLNDGKQLKLGDHVFVKLKGELSEIRGILRFKGTNYQDSKGILFGVELEVRFVLFILDSISALL